MALLAKEPLLKTASSFGLHEFGDRDEVGVVSREAGRGISKAMLSKSDAQEIGYRLEL